MTEDMLVDIRFKCLNKAQQTMPFDPDSRRDPDELIEIARIFEDYVLGD